MSTYANSLKKQVELLQGEVEVYAKAVDRLAEQLAEKEAQLRAVASPGKVDESETPRADDSEQQVSESVR
ncbi:hypothetical protein GR212_17190 [Rhizobium lusitanum]|uniref:Uncharacterized protein n=1 Tax=Rhizobium lusitanum TaxID=293958 RepID=A0A6L9U5W0_9HYPH|nr:hypothetical protein [Rhizobium lusitanum]NEI71315.1 hypothetical protein [Rhizobium lusitanum]